MRYRDMTPEQKEAFIARIKKWQSKNPDKMKEYKKKYRDEHQEEIKEKVKKWQSQNRDVYNALMKKQRESDLNSAGVPKSRIRTRSKIILYKIHSKIQGYEIHHCFGYEDPNKFIYIPKYLHTQIHRLLRDNNITADSNHWNAIRDLVNSCEEYTYIRT